MCAAADGPDSGLNRTWSNKLMEMSGRMHMQLLLRVRLREASSEPSTGLIHAAMNQGSRRKSDQKIAVFPVICSVAHEMRPGLENGCRPASLRTSLLENQFSSVPRDPTAKASAIKHYAHDLLPIQTPKTAALNINQSPHQ